MVLRLAPIIAVVAAAAAHADPTGVTFDEALGLTDQLPVLVVAREVAAAERTIELPRPWQPLLVFATPQLRVAPRAARGLEGGVALQQYVPLGDINGARRDVLARQADERLARAAATQLERRLEAAAAWIAAWSARERQLITEREYELARAIADVTARGLAAGVYIAPELADAQAFLAETDLRRTDVEGEVMHAGFTLARAMARTGSVRANGALPTAPLPPLLTTEELRVRARAMPAVAATRLSARVARARAAEEKATRATQVIVGAEAFRDEPEALVTGLTVGLALPHDRGERAHREALLAARLADAEAAQRVARAVTELEDALHEVEHTHEVLVKLRDQLVPAAEDAAARRKRAYELGESTIVELLSAQRTALLARARLTDAEAKHAWARITAWLLLEATRP
ncbi:MAG: TolC family protein [Kofleriaceae bacterium]|nr:TolC family protein [Kofleriaceae bacterium]